MATPMESRILGSTGRAVSVIGQGCWQFGGDWGDVADDQALDILRAGADAGVTFFDTADVYGDGRSERLVGRFIAERHDPTIMVATKMGRRANPHVAAAYTRDNFRAWNDRSRENLAVDTLDLVQLHCPPSAVYATDQVYEWLDEMVEEGRMAAYGVSVETVDEALTAMRHEHVASIQIILNVFRRRPLEAVLPRAAERGVGIIARVPLASGLLSGKFSATTTFAAEDHRTYNRHGEAFDQGETFSGVPYEVGLEAVDRLRGIVPTDATMAQFALRWIIDQPGVTTVIPGASRVSQAQANAAAASLAPLTAEQQDACREVYDEFIREHVHGRW